MNKRDIENLLKAAHCCFSGRVDTKNVVKIIPVAFPVLQSTWLIKIATVESSGLVDRYILRVLKEFGPCSAKKIDELLCLGEERIKNALIEMEELGSPITRKNEEFTFDADGDIENFRIEQEHEFSFCVNGITGALLPIDFCRKAKKAEIDDIEEDSPLYVKLNPIISGSESDLIHCRQGIDANKINEGIPDGFLGISERTPRQEFCRYFLSFIIVCYDKTSVFCMGDELFTLHVNDNYLSQLPKISRILSTTNSMNCQTNGLCLTQNRNTIFIDVQDQELWSNEIPDRSNTLMVDFIRKGWSWDAYKFSYFLLHPANAVTATNLFLSNASFVLENEYANFDTRSEVEEWFLNYYEKFYFAELFPCPPLDNLLEKMLPSRNSEVRDFARKIIIRKSENPLLINPGDVFHASTDENWKTFVIDWLNKAKDTIQIISPVIDSDLIFQSLNDASKRGVYLQIITSLTDRKGVIKTTGDKQLSSMQLPRHKLAAMGASVRATKYTPHAKIVIIDKSLVLFMSANLNDNSLGTGCTNALETCIAINEPSAVLQFVQIYDGIWESANFIQATDKNNVFVTQAPGRDLKDIPVLGQSKEGYILFSCPQTLVLEKSIAIAIKRAKSEVILMAMSFYDMDQVQFLYNTLLELLNKKISVTLLVRTGVEQFSSSEWPDESTKTLQNAGMQIVEVPHLHAKGVIVDGEVALVMSANFNPYSLGDKETSNIECGLLSESATSWNKQFISFVRSLMKE